MSYYPVATETVGPLDLDWPGAATLTGAETKELEWHHPSTSPFPLRPAGELRDGQPEGVEGEGLVPVWRVRDGDSWWAVDATSGQVYAGSLVAAHGPAVGRLAFFSGAALFISFLGSTILLWVLLMIAGTIAVAVGTGVGTGVSLAIGLLGLTWLCLRLLGVLPTALAEPVDRVQTGRIELPLRQECLSLLDACSYLMACVLTMGFLTAISAAWSGQGSLLSLLCSICQIALAAYLTVQCRALAQGHRFMTGRPVVLEGPIGELVAVGIRITLFAITGQVVAGLLGAAGLVRAWDTNWFMLWGTQVGALLGVATASISWNERGKLIAGLVGKAVGDALAGGWLAIVLALVAVAAPGMAAAFKVQGEDRRQAFLQSMRESWAFTFGLALGRLLGRTVGLFFLGGGGVAVGEALAEQLLGTTGLLSQRRAVEEPLPVDA